MGTMGKAFIQYVSFSILGMLGIGGNHPGGYHVCI